jgi:endogenous inhibitor of DNA gyrase (YacG/DUF329 family)
MRLVRCEHCGSEFLPVKPTRRFCSKSCSNLARWATGVYRPADGLTAYQRNRERILERRRREYAAHPEKQAARNLARKRTLVEPCEVPGCGKPGDRHHDDYAQPLLVRYLCRSHHISYHRSIARAS